MSASWLYKLFLYSFAVYLGISFFLVPLTENYGTVYGSLMTSVFVGLILLTTHLKIKDAGL
jgi:hypothetical protein